MLFELALSQSDVFTGDVVKDVAALKLSARWMVQTVDDGDAPDVGLPIPFAALSSNSSGWDVRAVHFAFNVADDKLIIGIDCFGICGDADGDGNPSAASPTLALRGGEDLADVAQQESIVVALDLLDAVHNPTDAADAAAYDAPYQFLLGVPAGSVDGQPLACAGGGQKSALNCFGLFEFATSSVAASLAVRVARELHPSSPAAWSVVNLTPRQSATAPDVVWQINNVAALRREAAGAATAAAPLGALTINFRLFSGSFSDDGIGEDFVPNFSAASVRFEPTATFSGNVKSDFAALGNDDVVVRSVIDVNPYVDGSSGVPDVGMPSQVGGVSGWDVDGVWFAYNMRSDSLVIGIDCFGICGDADGDGDAGGASPALAALGGRDLADLASSESIVIALDWADRVLYPPIELQLAPGATQYNAPFQLLVGVPGGSVDGQPLPCAGFGQKTASNCFGVYAYAPSLDVALPRRVGAALLAPNGAPWPAHNLSPVQNAASPDVEWQLDNVSALRALFVGSGSGDGGREWALNFQLFAGSYLDAGIGEDFVPASTLAQRVSFSAAATTTVATTTVATTTVATTTATAAAMTSDAATTLPFSASTSAQLASTTNAIVSTTMIASFASSSSSSSASSSSSSSASSSSSSSTADVVRSATTLEGAAIGEEDDHLSAGNIACIVIVVLLLALAAVAVVVSVRRERHRASNV